MAHRHCICSSQANSPQPSRVLSTAPAGTSTAYSSRMVPACSSALWPVTLSPHRPMRCAWAFATTRRPHAETHSCASRMNTHANTQHHSQACYYQLHFPDSLNPSLSSVPFWFGGIETWLGVVARTHRLPYIFQDMNLMNSPHFRGVLKSPTCCKSHKTIQMDQWSFIFTFNGIPFWWTP